MTGPTVPARVRTAKRLLEECAEECDRLPPGSQAYLQEAIEFLTQVEAVLPNRGRDVVTGQSPRRSDVRGWPTFDLAYTFTPDVGGDRFRFEPDEVVIFDPARTGREDGRWLSAKRDAYLPFEELL